MHYIAVTLTFLGTHLGTLISSVFGIQLEDAIQGATLATGAFVCVAIMVIPILLLAWFANFGATSAPRLFRDIAQYEHNALMARRLLRDQVRCTATILEEALCEFYVKPFRYSFFEVIPERDAVSMVYHCDIGIAVERIEVPMKLFDKSVEAQRAYIQGRLRPVYFEGVFDGVVV